MFQVVTFGYPRIKGPRTFDDRIVIVGGGMGGVHMASLLKVCILFSSVGGLHMASFALGQYIYSSVGGLHMASLLFKVCIYTHQWVVFIWPPLL